MASLAGLPISYVSLGRCLSLWSSASPLLDLLRLKIWTMPRCVIVSPFYSVRLGSTYGACRNVGYYRWCNCPVFVSSLSWAMYPWYWLLSFIAFGTSLGMSHNHRLTSLRSNLLWSSFSGRKHYKGPTSNIQHFKDGSTYSNEAEKEKENHIPSPTIIA